MERSPVIVPTGARLIEELSGGTLIWSGVELATGATVSWVEGKSKVPVCRATLGTPAAGEDMDGSGADWVGVGGVRGGKETGGGTVRVIRCGCGAIAGDPDESTVGGSGVEAEDVADAKDEGKAGDGTEADGTEADGTEVDGNFSFAATSSVAVTGRTSDPIAAGTALTEAVFF
jgi:hypothetical protein